MSSTTFDEWADNFMAEWMPDNDPKDMPSVNERRIMSDWLNGRIVSSKEAAIAYTRDTIYEETLGGWWFLVYHTAENRPETHSRLVELVRAITLLPPETRSSGTVQVWDDLNELAWDIREGCQREQTELMSW